MLVARTGSLSVTPKRPKEARLRQYATPILQDVALDLDVPTTLKNAYGGTTHLDRKPTENRKPIWYWSIFSQRAADLMRDVLPFMGERRSAQIREVLAVFDNELVRPPR